MKIVKRKSDNVVLYQHPDTDRVKITQAGLFAGFLRALDINTTDHEVVENVPACPRLFIGGHFTYDGSWAVVDEAAYFDARPVPSAVSRLAARLALIDAGLWSQIQPIIDGMPDGADKERTKAFFEDAQNWERNDPVLASLSAALGLTEEQLDSLFKQAEDKQ